MRSHPGASRTVICARCGHILRAISYARICGIGEMTAHAISVWMDHQEARVAREIDRMMGEHRTQWCEGER